ncbi:MULTISPECIES: hypothetical protein [unclassified Pseudomonas]|uniref:hypothetical protein n=1 Tax=unclassified Pseudomonas TaxID=196821 RepID=UPI00224AE3F5|nr:MULTISPECIES: hypothetical protein [unclassified Pseudomonas]MCX2890620.1 hypothetical protein [Pseudomonas sp. DCB_BI]MDH4548849.1 hypothetical protein [Pseudomonas sp. BN607]
MNNLIPEFVKCFGPVVLHDETVRVRNIIFAAFRRPYVKGDINTHGPLWAQYASPQGVLVMSELDIDKDTRGYIFVEGRGNGFKVFCSSLGRFLDFLVDREDGVFPAMYFVDENFVFCLCENGERGSMRPIYFYRGAKA